MSLTAGSLLGPYEILAPLGAGGMGEVYRARDTRLGRDVAVKVIVADAVRDSNRLARFEQEARATAALSHPNILAVHDIGQSAQGPFIVSELLEGETLRERLARGHVPARTAFDIGAQIARGLAAAHDKGIVHRDLKPDNVFLTKDGTAKILDFGLAKLRDDGPGMMGAADAATRHDAARTGAGVVMGTVGYMSPEQVRGEAADHRADIFALGCVLYELLADQRAFAGASHVETLNAILTSEPPDVSQTGSVPIAPGVERIVRRCLEKEPAQRFQSARDLAFAMEAVAESRSSGSVAAAGASAARWTVGRVVPWLLAASLAAALAWSLWPRPALPALPRMQFAVETPSFRGGNQIALSPSGSHVVSLEASRGLWLRALDAGSGTSLTGTDGANWPFWSRDGQSIAFFADGKLKRVELRGGPVQVLSDASAGTGGTWNEDGDIVFAPGATGPLFRVPAAGGVAAPLTTLNQERGETAHRHPQFLPDGRHFIYLALSDQTQHSGVYVATLDAPDGTFLAGTVLKAVFASPDALLFMRGDTLMAQRFDPVRRRLSGDAIPVTQQVGGFVANSAAGIAVSDTGMLAFRGNSSTLQRRSRTLAWFDRQGGAAPAVEERADYGDYALSPDGRLVVATKLVRSPLLTTADLWIIDLRRGTHTRFTSGGAFDGPAAWSPDGSRIAFSRGLLFSTADLYVKAASGVVPEELVLKSTTGKLVEGWSPDGRALVYWESGPNARDLWLLPLSGDKTPKPLVRSRFDDVDGQISSDGQWLAYASGESGRDEVYVVGFPEAKSRVQISTAGGGSPRWRQDGEEIVFASGTTMMAVDVSVSKAGELEPGVPRQLFDVKAPFQFDMTRDARRFLIAVEDATATAPAAVEPIQILLNWNPFR